MNWWQSLTAFFALGREVQEIKKTMVTRQQLDDSIAALPAAIESGITQAVTPLLQPIVARLNSLPAETGLDFSAEVQSLQGIPSAVSRAVGDSIAAVFAPLSPTSTSATPAPNAPIAPEGTPAANVA